MAPSSVASSFKRKRSSSSPALSKAPCELRARSHSACNRSRSSVKAPASAEIRSFGLRGRLRSSRRAETSGRAWRARPRDRRSFSKRSSSDLALAGSAPRDSNSALSFSTTSPRRAQKARDVAPHQLFQFERADVARRAGAHPTCRSSGASRSCRCTGSICAKPTHRALRARRVRISGTVRVCGPPNGADVG